jgi:hypothetical protein
LIASDADQLIKKIGDLLADAFKQAATASEHAVLPDFHDVGLYGSN